MKKYCHIPPKEGWKESSYYVVEVSKGNGNPVFQAILYTGFLNRPKNTPGGYSGVFNPTMEPTFQEDINTFYYIKAIREIDTVIPNKFKSLKQLDPIEIGLHTKIRK